MKHSKKPKHTVSGNIVLAVVKKVKDDRVIFDINGLTAAYFIHGENFNPHKFFKHGEMIEVTIIKQCNYKQNAMGLFYIVSPEFLPIDSFRKWKEKRAVCYSIEIVPRDLKKKILVIWYEKNKSPERAVFFDFPFPLVGILSFFMFEKKDDSPLDEKNDIKAVAEIMIRNIPGKDTEMLQATFFHVKRNAFFAVKTSSCTTSSLSVEKDPLCFGLLGDRKNWGASDRDSLQDPR